MLNILKRIGYRPVVDLYEEAILNAFSILAFFTPVALIILFTMLPNVNPALAITFFLIVAIEMFVLDSILKYTVSGSAKFLLKIIFYGT